MNPDALRSVFLTEKGRNVNVNRCENRHSFLRSFLSKFKGVSMKFLQGYLSFLALLINRPLD